MIHSTVARPCTAFKCSFCINNIAPALVVSGDIQAKILDTRLTTMTPYANHFWEVFAKHMNCARYLGSKLHLNNKRCAHFHALIPRYKVMSGRYGKLRKTIPEIAVMGARRVGGGKSRQLPALENF